MKKKLCIFTGYYLPHLGGVERYTSKLCEYLKDDFDITIVTSNHDDSKNHLFVDGIKIIKLPIMNIFKNRYPILKNNKEFKILKKEILEEKYDYYICNTRFHLTTLFGLKIAKHHKKKALVIEHGSSHFSVGNKILDFFGSIYEHLLTSLVKSYKPKFYGVSKRCNEWLKHFKINANGVLYNAIDANVYEKEKNNHYLTKDKKKIVITYAGRIIKEKGILLLLEVFKNIDNKNLVLYVAGDGPILEDIKKQYQEKNIKFLGKLNYKEVISLYNDTDIFVYPSMFPEGLPTTILEAGIMKTAVIATDRGGTIEVINDETKGLIMKENKESLEEKLLYLINNPKEITKMKENLYIRVKENFSWNKISEILKEELKNEEK